MQTEQAQIQPVEFVTLMTDDKIKSKEFTDNDDYTHASTVPSYDRFNEFPSGEGFISQLTIFDPNDDDECVSALRSVTQPSITCTYDSDTDDDDNDSASFDLIADMISNDERSVDDEHSLDDEMSIISDTHTANQSTVEYLTSAANTITRKCLERNEKLSRSFSKLIPPTPVPTRSNRLNEMKNRLRSLESQYQVQKATPYTEPLTPTFHVDASIDLKDSLICCIEDTPASPLRKTSKSASIKHNVLESAGEIITINLIIGLFYLIYMLYNNAISMIMRDANDGYLSFGAQ